MEQQLQAVGLSDLQAKAYMYLLNSPNGRKPTQLAEKLSITRTNAYKILDQLAEIDLVKRDESSRTYTYYAEDPIALTSFVSKARNRAIELEKHVKESLTQLQGRYQKNVRHAEMTTAFGGVALLQTYSAFAQKPEEVHLIRSLADVPFFGFETMHKVRKQHMAINAKRRFALTPDSHSSPLDPNLDNRTNLTRTWIASGDYTSPVEWMVCGDELAVLSFTQDGAAIRIRDKAIADSFKELWHLLDKNIRANPSYPSLPQKASRQV